MALSKMALFARKIQLESTWNSLFLKNNGVVTPEMSVLGDKIKSTIREILLIQEVQEEKYELLFGDGYFGKKL